MATESYRNPIYCEDCGLIALNPPEVKWHYTLGHDIQLMELGEDGWWKYKPIKENEHLFSWYHPVTGATQS